MAGAFLCQGFKVKEKLATEQGSVRITRGKFKARRVIFDANRDLRPVASRPREQIFNWLAPYLTQARCLDLYAGSGILGLEALSAGASWTSFVERSHRSCNAINDVLKTFGLEKSSRVLKADVPRWLEARRRIDTDCKVTLSSVQKKPDLDTSFEIVFLDPPYDSNRLKADCALLADSACVTFDSLIVVKGAADQKPPGASHWQCLKESQTRYARFWLYKASYTDGHGKS